MEKVLTFSVAAYNIEDTIDELMWSLIESGCMEQIEILIVDDGSKDATARKAAKYETQFPETVRLISKENGGHGSTINKGIEEARGKYFRPLDGDDWVESRNISGLLGKLQETTADMVICDYNRCYKDGRKERLQFETISSGKILSAEETLKEIDWICYHAVIYRTEILKQHQIRLNEHCFYVDNEYCLFPILYTETILYFNEPIYDYRLGEEGQSVSPASRMKHIDSGRKVVRSLLSFCNEIPEEAGEGKKRYIYHGTARHCIWFIYSLLIFPANKEKKEEIRKFDLTVKEKQKNVYEEMEKQEAISRIIRWLRKSNYHAYWIIKAYKRIKGTY